MYSIGYLKINNPGHIKHRIWNRDPESFYPITKCKPPNKMIIDKDYAFLAFALFNHITQVAVVLNDPNFSNCEHGSVFIMFAKHVALTIEQRNSFINRTPAYTLITFCNVDMQIATAIDNLH